MTAVPRRRCGNDPRAQLTDGDRQALADFRAYLERRAQEKTMSELSRKVFLAEAAAVNEHLAEQEQEQEQDATAKAEAALAPLEAKARAIRAQRDAKLRAEVLRAAADAIAPNQFGWGGPDHCDAWTAAQEKLRRLADEAQP